MIIPAKGFKFVYTVIDTVSDIPKQDQPDVLHGMLRFSSMEKLKEMVDWKPALIVRETVPIDFSDYDYISDNY